MVIARKLLAPTLVFFAIVLVVVILFFASSNSRSLVTEENRILSSLEQALQEELANTSKISLALAKQSANNPEIRSAFAAGDRQRLLELTLPGYQAIKGEYRINEHQFTVAPAKVVLDLDEPTEFGGDLSTTRLTLLAANTSQRDISGLEIADYGLCMHGIAPIQADDPEGAPVKGSVEYSIPIDINLFTNLRSKYGGEWQLLISTSALEIAGVQDVDFLSPGPQPNLMLQSSTLARPIYASADAYQQALRGQTVTGRVEEFDSTYAFLTVPLRDFSGQVVGVVDVFWDQTAALREARSRMILAVFGGLLSLIVGGAVLSRIISRNLQSVQALTVAAQAIAQGNLRHPLPALRRPGKRDDEVEQLNRSFHSMSQQLRQLVGDLEQRVHERTSGLEQRTNQLQAAAEIARDVTTQADVETLLTQAVNLIRQRFDFYHAGVFLTDDAGEFAVLRAATGEAGRQMLEDGHRLRVGRVGIVGAACGTGEPRLASDVESDATHYKNPLLPETRAEIAVPLRAGANVIGALDVQSRRPDAFGKDDITVLQIIADQLAIAVNNARLIQQLNHMVAELQEAHGQMTRENWQEIIRTRPQQVGYRYLAGSTAEKSALDTTELAQTITVVPLDRDGIPDRARQAIQAGQTIQDATDSISVPVRLRGQSIGAIHLRFDAPVARADVAGLVEEVSDRLALVMESARLLEEAQRLAQREQQINVIATQMRSSVNLETVLQNTVRELGKALGARRAFIQIGDYSDDPQAEVRRDV